MTTKSTIKNQTGHHKANGKGHKVTGMALSIVGFFWFAKKIGWIPAAAGGAGLFWPSVTIAAGLFMLIAINRHRKTEVRQ